MKSKPELAVAPQLPETSTDDEFLSSLRLDQTFSETAVGVRRVLNTVPVRKPNRDEFFRVHPEHHLDCYMLELKTDREIFFATGDMAQLLAEFVQPVRLRYVVSRQGVVFLWPVKLPKDDRRADAWRQSAAEAAALAEQRWVRIAADMHLGAYQSFEAVADLGEPRWPAETFEGVLKIGLRDRRIAAEDHVVVRQLLGKE